LTLNLITLSQNYKMMKGGILSRQLKKRKNYFMSGKMSLKTFLINNNRFKKI